MGLTGHSTCQVDSFHPLFPSTPTYTFLSWAFQLVSIVEHSFGTIEHINRQHLSVHILVGLGHGPLSPMPLPVEKSAGKVSSLVARWQTAANKEQEQAARQRDSDSRRSSTSLSHTGGSRRSSANHSVDGGVSSKPAISTVTGSGIQDGNGEGIEELKDFDELRIGNGDDDKSGAVTEVKQNSIGKIDTGRANLASSVTEKSTSTTILTDITGTKPEVESPKADMDKKLTNANADTVVTPRPATTVTPSKIPTLVKGGTSSTSSTRTKTTSASTSKTPRAVASNGMDTVKSTSTAPISQDDNRPASSETKSTHTPANVAAPTPAKSTPTITRPTQSQSKTLSTSGITAKSTPVAKSQTPRPAPSSFSRGTASKLTPSHTGPARRSSSITPGSGPSPTPAPLRPQMTGTPSKHTASSLAKAKEASERRKSITAGRQSIGSVKTQTGSSKAAATSSATPVRTTTTTSTTSGSGSRLLQGTASSRAKAAAVQPASPTRSAAKVRINSSTSTPSKAKGSTVNGKGSNPVNPISSKKPLNKDASAAESNEKGLDSISQQVEPPVELESILPRTPSPSTRQTTNGDDQDVIETAAKLESEMGEDRHTEIPTNDDVYALPNAERSAIIGRVGLAGAREAPTPSELGSTARETASDLKPDNNNDHDDKAGDGQSGNKTKEADDPESAVDSIHQQSDTIVEEPEMPRSAPSPFGRIGHAGGQARKHELEKPNPNAKPAGSEKRDVGKDVEWNEEELERDPAKTIVSPDTKSKGGKEGEKEIE